MTTTEDRYGELDALPDSADRNLLFERLALEELSLRLARLHASDGDGHNGQKRRLARPK